MSENTPLQDNLENAALRDMEPKLCVNSCGFFGNPMTANMCSKCYKGIEKEKRDRESDAEMPITPMSSDTVPGISGASGGPKKEARRSMQSGEQDDSAMATSSSSDSEQPEGKKPRREQPKKNRCWSCNKKVGLLGLECRCGYVYCGAHRYAEDHNCDYDFKENGRKHLVEQNPTVSAPKVPKI